MSIRRIAVSALAAAALTSGVGILAGPTAAAKPRQCAALVSQVRRSYAAWEINEGVYGADAPQTQSARQQYGAAVESAQLSGCY